MTQEDLWHQGKLKQRNNASQDQESIQKGPFSSDDNDDIKESADDILVPWDDTIWQFPNQNILKTMVCCPNTGNYKGASHQGCKQKNEIIGPKWYQQPSIPDNGIFKETYKCMYCNSQMLDQGLLKVRDHCHINGKYRGPAHSNCNKKLQMGAFKTKVPLICHNFRGYDSHLLIEVAGRFTSNKLKCIPENIGKYKAMDVGQLRFLDSFQHMSMGLDKLVECMNGNLEKFPLTKKHFADKGYSLEQIKFLFRKGVFPYDWTNSWDKFKKTALPRRKDFYSLLNQQNINDGLDPSHYVLAPGMFNDSLYKSSGAEIKLLTDLDQYMLVERAIRGGMSMVSQRYAKANNPQCPDYDESKPNSWVMYEDMNALYSGAMIQYLPTEILGKVAPEEIPNILEIPIDAEEGYLLEVDMEVPLNLHDLFNDYPLAPEKGVVPKNWLSPYNEDLVNDSEIGGGKYVLGEKLLQTLLPKKNYVVHYRALQLYINLGIKVTKIHEALKFHQSSAYCHKDSALFC
ncbi:14382_t:CDS:2 [Entrophospora sp. SA101]|nr:14382_t:CDS:2 [Entrophospora sp. SA101]